MDHKTLLQGGEVQVTLSMQCTGNHDARYGNQRSKSTSSRIHSTNKFQLEQGSQEHLFLRKPSWFVGHYSCLKRSARQ